MPVQFASLPAPEQRRVREAQDPLNTHVGGRNLRRLLSLILTFV